MNIACIRINLQKHRGIDIHTSVILLVCASNLIICINSQNKISKILKLCDERIEYENKKEFELRKFKQGLMQNMFI